VGLAKRYRKLVAIRSTQNLFMLEKALLEADPETTDVAVMTAHVAPRGDTSTLPIDLDQYDRELMTAVVTRAEKAGKQVKPLIVPTNNPLFAVVQTAKSLGAQEVILGASNAYSPDEQLGQIALYWINLHGGQPQPLTVRILSRTRDVYFDLAGGNRIPKIGERKARSVAQLRAAGVGIDRVVLVHYDTPESSDLFESVLTMLDPDVYLTVVPLTAPEQSPAQSSCIEQDLQHARRWNRPIDVQRLKDGEDRTRQLLSLTREGDCDLVIVGMPQEGEQAPLDIDAIVRNAACRVFLVAARVIPQETEE
jgi:nucleotide-binding universal stress UspA family protein